MLRLQGRSSASGAHKSASAIGSTVRSDGTAVGSATGAGTERTSTASNELGSNRLRTLWNASAAVTSGEPDARTVASPTSARSSRPASLSSIRSGRGRLTSSEQQLRNRILGCRPTAWARARRGALRNTEGGSGRRRRLRSTRGTYGVASRCQTVRVHEQRGESRHHNEPRRGKRKSEGRGGGQTSSACGATNGLVLLRVSAARAKGWANLPQ